MNQATVKNWQSRIGNKISRNKLRNKIIDIYRSGEQWWEPLSTKTRNSGEPEWAQECPAY